MLKGHLMIYTIFLPTFILNFLKMFFSRLFSPSSSHLDRLVAEHQLKAIVILCPHPVFLVFHVSLQCFVL